MGIVLRCQLLKNSLTKNGYGKKKMDFSLTAGACTLCVVLVSPLPYPLDSGRMLCSKGKVFKNKTKGSCQFNPSSLIKFQQSSFFQR